MGVLMGGEGRSLESRVRTETRYLHKIQYWR